MNLFWWRKKLDYMQTYTGVEYWPAAPRVADVRIIDIAHALSMLVRYTGHVRRFYSVAEHSVLVSHLVPPEHALCGLLHDAPEAYTNDINKPLKMSLPDYQRIEELNWHVIAEKFGLPREIPHCVHDADLRMLRTEQCQLMPYCQHTQYWEKIAVPGLEVSGWLPSEGEAKFLNRFYELTRGLGSQCKPSAHPASAPRWAPA